MKDRLQALVRDAVRGLLDETAAAEAMPASILIEDSRDPAHGDYACNVAMVLARPLKQPPRRIAEQLVQRLGESSLVERTEIAGPGFINFFLRADARLALVPAILAEPDWGHDRSGTRGRALVEFVSANPTGPMHVGHGRNAAYGDALAGLLAAAGWQVDREYYVNDAGRQVDVLTASCWLRYLQARGERVPFPSRGYPGQYLIDTAARLAEARGDDFRVDGVQLAAGLPPQPGDEETDEAVRKAGQERFLDALIERAHEQLGEARYAEVREFALAEQLAAIRATLASFNVHFDRWASERDIVESGAAARALAKLRERGHVYEEDGAIWLRSSALGDEKDRVLYKRDGAATYFANDLAYHEDKLERGYDRLIDVWGADHHGYIARVRAAIEALTGRPDALDVQLIQFVTLSSGRMGKRSGNFVTFDDLIRELDPGAVRFFYLMRSHDQHLEFDLELARSQSNENPVYYVQYAHARICSLFAQAEAQGIAFDAAAAHALARLEAPQERQLLVQLGRYPEAVRSAADHAAPHQMVHYLRELADALHSSYNANKCLVDDAQLRDARLALMAATRRVLANGLGLLGVRAVERM